MKQSRRFLGALAVSLALAAGCSARSGLTVDIVAGSGVQRPDALGVAWLSARGVIFQRDDVPVQAGTPLASVFIELDRSDASDRRILVRGLGPGASSSIGAARVRDAAMVSGAVIVTLQPSLPDRDGDGVPDVIDDCASGPCGVGDAAAPDAADDVGAPVMPAPDAAPIEGGSPAVPRDAGAGPTVDGASPLPTGGLVALWRMDDGHGTTVIDSSPTANAGTLVAPTGENWRPGHRGGALALSGTSWVHVPSSAAYDATQGLTLSAWVFWPRATVAGQVLMARQRGIGLENAFWLGFDRGQLHFSVEDQGIAVTVPAGRWMHLAGTFDGKRVIVYLDGVQIGQAAVTVGATAGAGVVSLGADVNGADSRSGVEMFEGGLDEVAIYDRALSPQEIAPLAR
jgi:large repetitive protein